MYTDDSYGSGYDPDPRFPRPLTVSEINEFIKRIFDGIPQLTDIYINGEISNFKDHYSTGHLYFTLKDDSSSIKAVMFRAHASRVKFIPENGMKVTVHGRISTYPKDGQYQIYCDSMEPLGIGALFAAFEQLKKKLAAEGLFDEAHKKSLPEYPSSVGVVTSATGAAVKDIINIAGRRYPLAEIVVYPALVQGSGAAESLLNGIRYFNESKSCDVIIIGRGGGSIEDLWAFNDEALAREIYASDIPIISAVGHETDFTICDFVSDVRAPTPSAASELALPDSSELRSRLSSILLRQRAAIDSKISSYSAILERYKASRTLTDHMAYIDDRYMHVSMLAERLTGAGERSMNDRRNTLSSLSGMLNTLSPLAVLSRGYSMTVDGEGTLVKSVDCVSEGEEIVIKVSDGSFGAEVKSIIKGQV
ncbi:MAG: exodeoxyribonuclease VII large subunit [Clostridia bacterium]|nr:exodeoxyribonuclease VII large subunit [Clostridia bacterium]